MYRSRISIYAAQCTACRSSARTGPENAVLLGNQNPTTCPKVGSVPERRPPRRCADEGGQRQVSQLVAPFRSPFAFALFVLSVVWLLFESATAIRPALTTVCGAWLWPFRKPVVRTQTSRSNNQSTPHHHNDTALLGHSPEHTSTKGLHTTLSSEAQPPLNFQSVPPRSAVRALR